MLWSLGRNLVLDVGWHSVNTFRIFFNLIQNLIVVDGAVHGLVIRKKLLISFKFIRDIDQISGIPSDSSGIILLLGVDQNSDELENAFRFCPLSQRFHCWLN